MRSRLTLMPQGLDAATGRRLGVARTIAAARDARLWLVGGAVRDIALDLSAHDLDLVLDDGIAGFARDLHAALAADGDGDAPSRLEVREQFGTASITGERWRIDLARLRAETYDRPGALPRVIPTDEIERDLARRDFTVNAIALALEAPDGVTGDSVVDPYGGLRDLSDGVLRVLHPASFQDDATRIWRGARTAVIASLTPDPETARLIADGTRWLDTISGDRLWAELELTAERGRAGRVLEHLEAWRALPAQHPALHLHERTRRALRHRPRPLPAARLAALLIAPLEDPAAVLARFSVDREVRETVLDTARLLAAGAPGEAAASDLEAVARLEGVRDEARVAAHWLDPAGQAPLQRALGRWERTRSPLSARQLMRLGVPQGPALGRTLDRLRRARFLGTLSTAAEARAAVRAMRDEAGAAGCE